MSGQFVYGGDFRFSCLLIKYRKVSGSDDTRNQVARKGSWVRIPSSPPLGNNTNPDDKLEFVLFFSNEYFGIKVDLNGKKKNQPGVSSLGFFYAQITPRARLAVEFGSFLRHHRTILSFSLTFAIAIERKRLNIHTLTLKPGSLLTLFLQPITKFGLPLRIEAPYILRNVSIILS